MNKKISLLIAVYLSLFSSHALSMMNYFKPPTYFTEKIEATTFTEQREALNRNVFIFDPIRLAWAVYDKKGQLRGVGKAIGGKDFCPDIQKPCRTIEGEFTVFRTEGEDCKSSTFPVDKGGSPMPYCMFFHEGYAIHGTNLLPNQNASHGCIRVTRKAAEWMNKNYLHTGAEVIVLPYDASEKAEA